MSTEGQEVLVIDADENVQRGLEQLLRAAAMMPTVLADVPRALDLATQKFFAVAVVDLDTPGPGEGMAVLAQLRERSPNSALVALSARRAYDATLAAFRFGVDDVVVKAPDQVGYLRDRIATLAGGKLRETEERRLLAEVSVLHDDLLKELLGTHRRVVDLEAGSAADAPMDDTLHMLVVDDSDWLGGSLAEVLPAHGGYALSQVATGGEALDASGRERFQIALVKELLIDLPGSMVARTIKSQSQDTIVLLYSTPAGPRPGKVEIVDTQRSIPFLPTFVAVQQLADRLGELGEAYHATNRERRYLASFRQQHFELLRRYQEAKAKLGKLK